MDTEPLFITRVCGAEVLIVADLGHIQALPLAALRFSAGVALFASTTQASAAVVSARLALTVWYAGAHPRVADVLLTLA